ncbi:flagellar biosynthetic protein FliO [Bordetella flabilis]|uniref:Flagellar protein n=1 Tax=Bordetella flabilis TaxID=463014 RepID=A0A193GG58_9BORD|nr:flagellar biosynthetic protein FliO [Bordetella flabilis]ANN78279.1 flagellar biosynthetic protein FliO [Bordetella flabilis]
MADAAPLRVFLGLIVVIGAILLCGWIARRAGLAGRAQGGALRVVHSLNVGPRQRIVLVEVENARLLVGVTPGQMNLLHTLPPGEPVVAQTPGPLAGTFAARLGQALRRG